MVVGVAVPVVDIRIVRVLVCQAGVVMGVGVRLAWRVAGVVDMLMVLVVRVPVLMLHSVVCVFVLVPLGQMKPQADCH